MGTPEYPSMMRLRKIWAEDSFSVLKREHCISKIRKRGILAATEECLLAAMALNSFAISQFIILLEPLLVSAVFLLLSTDPLLYIIAQYINNSVLNILYRMTWPLIILTVKTNLERWVGACFWYWRCFSSCIFVAHLKESCLI